MDRSELATKKSSIPVRLEAYMSFKTRVISGQKGFVAKVIDFGDGRQDRVDHGGEESINGLIQKSKRAQGQQQRVRRLWRMR